MYLHLVFVTFTITKIHTVVAWNKTIEGLDLNDARMKYPRCLKYTLMSFETILLKAEGLRVYCGLDNKGLGNILGV